ncbi:MAG: squalene--hopene cyclase [Verrucomicrobiota bacterium]
MNDAIPIGRLKEAIDKALTHLLSFRNPAGYWVFDLEADVTIPSEYLLLQRFLGRPVAPRLRERLARYLRGRQLPDGGWPLYEAGAADVSASVKAYFALKVAGDPPDAPHMDGARRRILALGGAARTNVFTRITLALFGQIPWHTAPAMPVEIMLLPRWFFFHLRKVSYWSRAVIVPLLILYAKRPVCPLGEGEGIAELFLSPPARLRHLDRFVPGRVRKNLFLLLDRALKRADLRMPASTREKAIRLAERWMRERMREEGGIGGIFPAMANAVMALKVLGYTEEDPDMARGIRALDGLLAGSGSEEAYIQPCLSPVWDTCLSLSAALEAGLPRDHAVVTAAIDWLFERQVLERGDWFERAPGLAPGGWAFQFENAFYPDLDDTAKVLLAMIRAGVPANEAQAEKVARAVEWILGMQSSDGGWGAFDVDNRHVRLNDIPFADHGALLDPSTADVTGRCVELLAVFGYGRDFPPMARALEFLRREQEPFGAWFGRWGVNYLYGTWSVLMALRQAGEDLSGPCVRGAVDWLSSRQNPDGGWGESCRSYSDPSFAGRGESTASQTAWALLGLMAAGEADGEAVRRGIAFLLDRQNDRGGWDESHYTGTGFPKVFFLRYHGYRRYFPLWALGVHLRLRTGEGTLEDRTRFGRPGVRPAPAAESP